MARVGIVGARLNAASGRGRLERCLQQRPFLLGVRHCVASPRRFIEKTSGAERAREKRLPLKAGFSLDSLRIRCAVNHFE